MPPAEKTVPPTLAASAAGELPRVLGALSAASILIGSIIGSGIFKNPSKIATALPAPGWILVAWAAAGFLSLIGSLIFAELGSAYPGAGGQYTYIRESFGKLLAFLFGWTNLLIINAFSIAALGKISSQSLFGLLPAGWQPHPEGSATLVVAVVMVGVLTAVNAVGVRHGAGIQNILTVLKLGALGLIIAGLFLPTARWENLSGMWEIRGEQGTGALLSSFKNAFLAILWAYDGWYLLSFSGGEIRNPRRNIPIGFILGILVVISVYIAANVSYFSVLTLEDMKRLDAEQRIVAEEAGYRLYGELGVFLILAGIMCSTLGAANGNILTGPRLSYAMAKDGLFYGSFGGVHARYRTPFIAIVAQGVLAAALVFAGDFHQLTDSVVFAAWIFYLLTIVGYYKLRKQYRSREGVFIAPGYPVLPAIFIAFAVPFIIYSAWDAFSKSLAWWQGTTDSKDGLYPVISLLIMLAGVPAYALFRRGSRRIETR
jgi:basic amino acid/polyamine antiporter, APA family